MTKKIMNLYYINRVFLTDLTGTIIYDYWDLPVENPEGIAINNDVDPPMLYIATDPSAPSGPQYVPLVLGFYKPKNGTGYVYWDQKHLPDYVTNPPPCHGCHKVFEEAYENGFERAYYWENHFPEAESSGSVNIVLVSVLVPVCSSVCILMICSIICVLLIRKRITKKKGNLVPNDDPDELLQEEEQEFTFDDEATLLE